MFAIRERLDDDEFLAQWQPAGQRASRVLLDSTGPHALLRYTIGIERPEQIERQFLFLVHALAPQLATMQQPGTELVLIPQRIAQRNAGVTTGDYEAISYCLPLGAIPEPLAGLTQALAHVGNGGRPSGALNRAQRRAQQRGKRPGPLVALQPARASLSSQAAARLAFDAHDLHALTRALRMLRAAGL